MKYWGFILFALLSTHCLSQFQVRDSSVFDPHISLSFGYQTPAGDLADRFGNNGSVGLGFHIKSRKNWYYGLQGTYMFGNRVNEPGLLSNLYTERGEILDNQGQIATVFIQQRGWCLTANGGKILPIWAANPNSGILVMGGVGFMQHKIRIEHQEHEIRFLDGDYEKGYDRLTNGITTYQFAGYFLMSNNRLVNFFAGVESYQGFTRGRRDLNFDTGEKDDAPRMDILLGLRVGWVLHLYERAPDQYYYN